MEYIILSQIGIVNMINNSSLRYLFPNILSLHTHKMPHEYLFKKDPWF